MIIVNCVDLGDPPYVDGVPPPVRFVGDGINNQGIVAGAVVKKYPSTTRVVAVALITPLETFSFTSPFGFKETITPVIALLGDDKVVFSTLDQSNQWRVVIGDSSSRTVDTSLPKLNRIFWASWVCDQSIYGAYTAVDGNDSDNGTFVIEKDKIRKVRIPGFNDVHINATSPNGKHQSFTAKPDNDSYGLSHLLVSNGRVETIDRRIRIDDLNNAGTAVAKTEANGNIVVLISGSSMREFDVGAPVGWRTRINSSGVIAGSRRVNGKYGIFLIVDDQVVDLMTQPSIAQYGFSNVHVSGFNDLNQILLEGEIEGQEGSRLYRCDVDLYASVIGPQAKLARNYEDGKPE